MKADSYRSLLCIAFNANEGCNPYLRSYKSEVSVTSLSFMELLQQRIVKEGVVKSSEILKVDSFLNHQIDTKLFKQIGQEFQKRFENEKITKILTIEASGIGVACITALYFDVPVVFAKKTTSKICNEDLYTTPVHSFTHGVTYDILVTKKFLNSEDRILIIDDFLANGNAIIGLKNLVEMAGATLVGAGIVIEKGFQGGGDLIRGMGIRLESLAIVDSMSPENGVTFRPRPSQ